jgi:hypothetical protein
VFGPTKETPMLSEISAEMVPSSTGLATSARMHVTEAVVYQLEAVHVEE